MSYVEKMADDLADQTMAIIRKTGDESLADKIAEALGSSSQTAEEAFMTAIRVRRAEVRARKILAEFDAPAAPRQLPSG